MNPKTFSKCLLAAFFSACAIGASDALTGHPVWATVMVCCAISNLLCYYASERMRKADMQ